MIAFPARVLVVDDNVDAAESLAMLLQSDGHTVSVAHNGVDAVQRAEAWRPDIAVLDVGLPGMNGYEVASVLRQRGEACPELIAVTGYGQAADTKRAFEAGFRFHLVKPVDARDLTRPSRDAPSAARRGEPEGGSERPAATYVTAPGRRTRASRCGPSPVRLL